MGRRLAGNVRAGRHRCLSEAEIAASMRDWEITTMGWTVPQQALRASLDAGTLVSVYSGGNYSTKTFGVVATAFRACAGMESWCSAPANVALCALSQSQGRGAFQQYLQRFLRRPGLGDLVHNATKREGMYTILEFCNGSVLDIITVGQGDDMHAGARRSLTVYDEEPTYGAFEEGLFRYRSGMQSRIVFTMTPKHGKSWVWDTLMTQADRKDVGLIQASVFENAVFRCIACGKPDGEAEDTRVEELVRLAKKTGAPPPTETVDPCRCVRPRWTIPGCPACGRTRAEWDQRLASARLSRDPETHRVAAREWIQWQIQATRDGRPHPLACARCWTYGVEPRAQEREIRNKLRHVANPKRIAMRFCGWWEELDGQSVCSRGQLTALRRYARPAPRTEGPYRNWEPRNPSHGYTMGCDMAHGTGGDEIAFAVLNTVTGHQDALWADHETPWIQSLPDCVDMAREYDALLVPETASTGDGLIEYLKAQPDLRLYHYRSPDRHIRSVLSDRAGFAPSARNSDRIRQNFVRAVLHGLVQAKDETWQVVPNRRDACYLRDPETVEQFGRWFYNEQKHGKITKPAGPTMRDDRCDAMALAWEGRTNPEVRTSPKRVVVERGDAPLWRQWERHVNRWGAN